LTRTLAGLECEGKPGGNFDAVALDVISKLKFELRIIDGVLVEGGGSQKKFRFELGN